MQLSDDIQLRSPVDKTTTGKVLPMHSSHCCNMATSDVTTLATGRWPSASWTMAWEPISLPSNGRWSMSARS